MKLSSWKFPLNFSSCLFYILKPEDALLIGVCFILYFWKLSIISGCNSHVSKTVIVSLKFTLSFLKNVIDQAWVAFNTKFEPQWKDQEKSCQLRHILALFCKLVALILH